MQNSVARKYHYMSVAIVALTLSACCSPGVKPEDANLFQASCGVASGQYEEDLKDKQKQVNESSHENSTERGRSMQLETMLVTRQSEYEIAQQDLDSLKDENRILANKIDAMQAKTQKDQSLKKQYLSQLGQLNSDIEMLKTRVSEAPDENHLVELEALKREVETLRVIVLGQ